MPIKTLHVKKLSDFDKAIYSRTVLTGKEELLFEEIERNMCCISLSQKALQNITREFMNSFWLRLIKAKQQQCARSNTQIPATLYIWFDELAAQLRFNILSGHKEILPFECNVQFVDDIQKIFQEFLTSPYHEGIPIDEFEILDKDNDIADDAPFTLKVFRTYFNG